MADEDAKGGEVIDFPVGTIPSITVKRERYDGKKCYHRGKKLVSDSERVVKCGNCDEQLDPFDVLNDLASAYDGYRLGMEHHRKERERLAGEVEKLKGEEQRAKARIRTANRKESVQQEHERILGLLATGLDRFCDGFARQIDHDRAEGILWGFREVLWVLPKSAKRESLERRTHAARQEIDARRRRRGVRPNHRTPTEMPTGVDGDSQNTPSAESGPQIAE